jgi:HEAT repeat protein
MCVLSLLRNLGKDAGLAEPAVARAMEEEDTRVRVGALSCYELGMLEGIGEKQKVARLPAFVLATRDSEWAVRNNAVVALQFYTNQAKIVTPVLLGTLKDSDFHVRMTSAEALARVDVQAGIQAGILPMFVSMLKDPNLPMASRATRALGDLGTNASPAVPALIEAAKSTNRFVAQNSLYALKKIDPEAAVNAAAK